MAVTKNTTKTKVTAKKKAVAKKATKPTKTYQEVIASPDVQKNIRDIKQWVDEHSIAGIPDYSNWFIGVSATETNTKGIKYLLNAKCKNRDAALTIERYFHEHGMHVYDGKEEVSDNIKYAYVHKVGKGFLE